MFKRLACFSAIMVVLSIQPAIGSESIKLGAIFAKSGAAAPSNLPVSCLPPL